MFSSLLSCICSLSFNPSAPHRPLAAHCLTRCWGPRFLCASFAVRRSAACTQGRLLAQRLLSQLIDPGLPTWPRPVQAAGMVRAWGPVVNEATLEALLPTLRSWVQQLGGEQWQGQGPGDSDSGSDSRPRFSPPAAAVWRALHGLLPLVQGAAAGGLLPALPSLADIVLAGVGGRGAGGPTELPQERELCRWFAVGCWSHLLTVAGAAALDCAHLSAEGVVQELVAAAAPGSGSERLHKAAAEAVAATLRHSAAGGARVRPGAAAALCRGLFFLLHDIPHAAASGAPAAGPRPHLPSARGYSPLTAAVAEAAAHNTLLHLLQHGGEGAAAALACSHFWLPPLCASLRQQHAEQRSPALYAVADKAAVRLTTACIAGEVAALSGTASWADLAGSGDPAVAAVAQTAAQQPHSWQCLPALWRALVQAGSSDSSSEAQEACALLLAAAAELAAARGRNGGAAAASLGTVPVVPVAFGAGFAAPGLSSSLASDIESAQRLPGTNELRSSLLGPRECWPALQRPRGCAERSLCPSPTAGSCCPGRLRRR